MRAVDAGLIRGVSPGFRVPPASAVANAEELVDEPGNPDVQIRQINQAVLYELSLVTRPAYVESEGRPARLRAGTGGGADGGRLGGGPVAVTLTTTALAEALAVNQALADRLHPVAVALVEDFAPAAPESVQNLAAERVAGWLALQPHAAVTSETTGDIGTRYAVNNLSALRHSGAGALLTRWHVRRGGVIG